MARGCRCIDGVNAAKGHDVAVGIDAISMLSPFRLLSHTALGFETRAGFARGVVPGWFELRTAALLSAGTSRAARTTAFITRGYRSDAFLNLSETTLLRIAADQFFYARADAESFLTIGPATGSA